MQLKFYTISNATDKNSNLIKSMHELRFAVFVELLNWKEGIQVRNGKEEHDEYDNDLATYIIATNEAEVVLASCRLIPTSLPYMLAEKFPNSIDTNQYNIPRTNKIWEISRFCVAQNDSLFRKAELMKLLIIEIMKFGLDNKLKNFISLTTKGVIPKIEKYSGWKPTKLGSEIETSDDISCAIRWDISQSIINNAITTSIP